MRAVIDQNNFSGFDSLLAQSVLLHGHLCAGQVIGVRMAMVGLRLLKLKDPKGCDRKKLYVFVEIDRCATDAIQSVTGCSLGKRTMRHIDFGIMAATFVHLDTFQAYRITAREESRDESKKYFPGIDDKYQRQLEAYKVMDENELFRIQKVIVRIPKENLPGKPLKRVKCDFCGDWVQDKRDQNSENKTVCRGCSTGKYYILPI